MRRVLVTPLLLLFACASDPEPHVTILDQDHDLTPAQDMPPDLVNDLDATPDPVDLAADLPFEPLTLTAPFDPDAVTFIDVHMHCDAPSIMSGQPDVCVVSPAWRRVERELGGAGLLLSVEHWAVTIPSDTPILPYDPLLLNELYTSTVPEEPRLAAFTSLECWHDTPFGDGWAEACKEDARWWVEHGALGFKDHVGKQWDSNGDTGSFVGGWNRKNGLCDVPASSTSPNVDCAKQPSVIYPIRHPEWREVIRYITEELKVPVVTHASTYPDPTAEADTRCFDPHTGEQAGCGAVSRKNQLEFARWAKQTLSPPAFRRIIFAHLGFSQGQELIDLLDTGATLDTAVTDVIMSAGCQGRQAFSLYPDQFVMGTDRRVGQDCLFDAYSAWMYAFTGPSGQQKTFQTCLGPMQVKGMELGTAHVANCPYDVPEGTLEKILKLNFLALYPQ